VITKGGLPAPLDGVRVLDLSRVVSGPMCGRILADLGAEVIKVEPPGGDVSRTVPPFIDGMSAYFAQLNAGKRNVCIDLKAPGGADLVRRLAATSDVVIENFRPGVLARFALDAETLLSQSPQLVYCSISGWGQDGPWRARPAYAPLVHAQAGTIDMAARLRRRPPEQEVHVHGDIYPAIFAANAVIAALFQRTRTGSGQHLDVAMGEVVAYANEWAAVEFLRYGPDRSHDIWTNKVMAVADGTGVAMVGNPLRLFRSWVQALGGTPILDDPRFASDDAVYAHEEEALAVLAELVARVPDFATFDAALQAWPMLAGEVRSLADLAETPWARQRGLAAEIAPGLSVPGAPWRSTGATIGAGGPAAQRGQHNQEVLAELLGLSRAEVESRVEAGTVLAG
jgi:CoA:oxalate CoA-transferase